MSPKKYRDRKGAPPLKRQTILDGEQVSEHRQMSFHILHSKGFEVVGMECIASKWDEDGAIGRLWSDFLSREEEIEHALKPMIMYGICEHENCDGYHFKYLAAVGVDCTDDIPSGMVRYSIKEQTYLQASVPDYISVPDAYAGTIGYAKSLGYEIEDYDNVEVYEEIFQDPAFHSFRLLIPIKEYHASGRPSYGEK
jgi:predicted transcriptional regulator YdeE